MISNIQDLQDYVLEKARQYDDINYKRRFLLTSPGCAPAEIAEIKKALSGMPDSYLRVAERVNLNGITIGYLRLSPGSYYPGGMAENLISNQKDRLTPYARRYHLYLVGGKSSYEVYVATSSSCFAEGEVIAIDYQIDEEDPLGAEEKLTPWILPLAKDFEQFLIATGNLHQVTCQVREDFFNEKQKEEEFIEILRQLGIEEKYLPAWRLMYY